MNFNEVTANAETSNPLYIASMRKSKRAGEIKHSATGWLYGISEDNIPSRESIMALKPQTLASKNKDGLQHPTGDVWRVSDTFFDAGGQEIQVYLQDHYLTFPYNSGIKPSMTDYINEAILPTVKAIKGSKNADKWSFVPFNEADWIWYQVTQSDANLQSFCNDWKTVYQAIKAEWKDAKVVGPNFAFYYEKGMTQFLNFAVKNECAPDIISWHELEDDSFNNGWFSHIQHYRDLEASCKIGKRKIVVNEYAEAQQCSVPGELVKYISGFETEGVYACLPYWNIANNLDDLMADYNTPNAAWWLYKWYADMSGDVVNSYSDFTKAYGLKGLTSIDEKREIISTIFGGSSGNVDFEYNNLQASPFKDDIKLHVEVSEIAWSGYDGASIMPSIIFSKEVDVNNSKLNFTLNNLNKMNGYKVVITKATNTNAEQFSCFIEAESELVVKKDAIIATRKDINAAAWEHFAMSYEGEKVTNGDIISGVKMNAVSSEAQFDITVPKNGVYELSVIYGGYSREFMTQNLTINGAASIITYDPTINVSRVSAKSIYVSLNKGENSVKLKNISANMIIDRFNIKYCGDDFSVSNPQFSVSAVNSDIVGLIGSDVVSGFGEESSFMTSVIVVDRLGNYKLSFSGKFEQNGALDVSINNNKTGNFAIEKGKSNVESQVFLNRGVNIIRVSANVDCFIGKINATYTDNAFCSEVEMENGTLSGTAVITPKDASGKCVSVGGGKENSVSVDVDAPYSGAYKLVVYYASNDAKGAHMYNIDSIDPYVQMDINEKTYTSFYRSSYHWDKFITVVIDVALMKGDNTITFYNDNSYNYNGILDTIDPSPKLDKIQIYSIANAPKVEYVVDEPIKKGGCGSQAKYSNIALTLLSLGGLLVLLAKKRKIKD